METVKDIVHKIGPKKLSGAALALILFRLYSKNTKKNPKVVHKSRGRKPGSIDNEFLQRLKFVVKTALPSLICRESANILLLTLVLFGRTWMTLYISNNMGLSIKHLCNRDWEQLRQSITAFVFMTIPAALLNGLLKFLTQSLSVNIREKVTLMVHDMYMKDMNYYRANKVGEQILENGDQLIAEDVEKFSSTLSEVYSNLLKPIVDFVFFSLQLGRWLGARGPLGMYGWFFVAAYISSLVIPSYGRLASQEQRLEGYFRAFQTRIISNSEMIAFMGGEVPEKKILDESFDEIKRHQRYTHKKRLVSNLLMGYVNKYAASSVGFGLIILPVLWNEGAMNNSTPSEVAKYYVATRQVMEGLSDAVLRLFDVQKQIGKLSGLTDRVYTLINRLQTPEHLSLPIDPDNHPEITVGDDDEILSFDRVSVFKPDGTLLIKDLTFDVPDGTRVMVTGENGCGKSSLFRVLRGLWPLAQGKIITPPDSQFYFLSQVNFVPIGTLRDVIIYPDTVQQMNEKGVDNDRLLQVLEWAHLGGLELNGQLLDLDDQFDWQTQLSPGQKQRIAFARLLYHHPRYAVLDECTNGVAPGVERDLYERCRKNNITVFSISHKTELKELHDYELHYHHDGKGSWSFIKLH
eukprot:TRINITY_DN11166_c0_g1_i1.p1 TRINITY_DN11166_c0_g1~~TRINITY_DN11166_c0_g1_i1.p1  ORF type:complete len:633 (+),score=115.90 TRINITY_DN11166_c0_g1_i1:67-1965(+)